MKYFEFYKNLSPFKVFSKNDIKKFYPKFDSRRLYEWQKKNYIKKIRNNYYIFSDIELSENLFYIIANKIYSPSYISLESALSFYNIIPEGVFTITSISTKKTSKINSPLTLFSYRNIKKNLFFGYGLVNFEERNFKIATPEKTILDYLYLNNSMISIDDIMGLRWNIEILKTLDKNKIELYLKIFSSDRLYRKFDIVISYIEKYARLQ